jgi:hypothetical protein
VSIDVIRKAGETVKFVGTSRKTVNNLITIHCGVKHHNSNLYVTKMKFFLPPHRRNSSKIHLKNHRKSQNRYMYSINSGGVKLVLWAQMIYFLFSICDFLVTIPVGRSIRERQKNNID